MTPLIRTMGIGAGVFILGAVAAAFFFYLRTPLSPEDVVVRDVSVEDGTIRLTVDFPASGIFFAGHRIRNEAGAVYVTIIGTPVRFIGTPLPVEVRVPYQETPSAVYLEGKGHSLSIWTKPS